MAAFQTVHLGCKAVVFKASLVFVASTTLKAGGFAYVAAAVLPITLTTSSISLSPPGLD
ncbi:hypothetical protein CGLO_08550 [Colletotrichum gloeosporioides Cg-14]|uniref:Uncharacterized protein n=1 Tax=Colletotrichum gloeosporioides (strain Cg-14) TaxID=1237896 RepID=T0K8L2_COLGC|nr:hypothetical protein CGLO_08550 [Colletotrichum gloeosporioides Cg-14]